MNSLIVVGLGYGDEGKGSIVDFLCSEFDVDFVVKYSGGHQAGHRVAVGDKEHVFSQFGAGALAGVPTILDREFVVELRALAHEHQALEGLGGCVDLHIHPSCPVTTPYHRAFNRLRESMVRHGSCGVGVGVTRQTEILGIGLTYDDTTRFAGSEDKIRRIRSWLISEASQLCGGTMDVWDRFYEAVEEKPRLIAEELHELSVYPFSRDPGESWSLVFEGSQGVLLDESYGEHPYTTWSTVTPRNAREFPGVTRDRSVVIGVMRTYLTRHGNGNLHYPHEDVPVCETKDDPNNQHNPWQGSMRRSVWTSDLFRQSLRAARPDCLAVNHYDVDEPAFHPGLVAIKGNGPDRSNKSWLESKLIDRLRMKKRSCVA